jgi:hypothetical protein
MGWTVDTTKTYTREIEHGKEKATVTMRPLDAGDRAELSEIRLMLAEGGDEGILSAGRIKILTVAKAIVSWTIPSPNSEPFEPTEQNIRTLEPDVFEQLFDHVSFGTPEAEKIEADLEAEATEVPDDPLELEEPDSAIVERDPVSTGGLS